MRTSPRELRDSLRRVDRRARSWLIGFTTACFGLRPRERDPLQYFRAPSCSCALSSAIAIRPWAFAVLQGITGKPPPSALVAWPVRSAPLMGFLLPTAVVNAKGPLFPGLPISPARCVFRVRALLTPCLPFTPSSHLWPGRSWDCYLQGFSPPGDPDRLSTLRAFLAVA
jgi:hypothetical protein